jgi:hypothetical protein
MAVTVFTDNPKELLADIRKAVEHSSIETWEYSAKGNFTHSARQWKFKAWFRPSLMLGKQLKFNILRPKGQNISKEVYAVYHGRFAEMLLAHFDSKIESVRLSALAEKDDVV